MATLPTNVPRPCASGVCDPERTQGLQAPAPQGGFKLVVLEGPGVFLGAEVTKQGGSNDLTFVDLSLDGRNVFNISYAAAHNVGFTAINPAGTVLLSTGVVKNLTLGFPTPLRFERSLVLSVEVKEDNVVQVLGNVWHGAAN
jgi:hypothetical protein